MSSVTPPPAELSRLRVAIRNGRLLVDAGDLVASLRRRARAYRHRAEQLVTEPDPPREARIVAPIDEALACRMVAEELEQRADDLDSIG